MIAIKGTLKRNSKGRAYLIFYDQNSTMRLVRVVGLANHRNGQVFTVSGDFRGGRLYVKKALPHRYPDRGPAD